MKRIGVVLALFLAACRPAPAPTLEAGVSRALADDRAGRVHDLGYEATFDIPAAKASPVRGRLTATFTLASPLTALAFDFAQPADRLLSVRVNDRAIPPAVDHGHVVIPAAALRPGSNTVAFEFLAGDQSLNRNDDYMYTLFVPSRASLAMPCFDQPDLKARWRLSLDIPADWTAVANGAETGRLTTGGRTRLMFAETEPLPTYLLAFAAGKFHVETAQRDGRTFRMFHRETDAAKVARNRDAIFDLHAKALAWLEQYTGIPYPFGKFDFVLIPSFQFSGMEHAGAIYYNASSLMLDETATENQRLARANVISHETSHMWFGDLVTMRWFNDVWLKEVFANFMAAKIVNPSFPDVNHPLRFFLQNYPVAYDVDRTDGANPIRQDLANLNDAGTLYGAIIYQKAPIVMRQLELQAGADNFRDGLRTYLHRFAFGNATWDDLVGILNDRTAADLRAWSHAWVDEPGRPTITTDAHVDGGRLTRLAFDESDPRGRGLIWPERMHVVLGYAKTTKAIDVTIGAAHTVVNDAAGLPAPLWILPTGGGLAYGDVDLDADTLTYLTRSVMDVPDPVDRGAAIVTLWEAMLDGHIPTSRMLDVILTALPRERDELNVEHLLGLVRVAFWRFTPAPARLSIAPRVEETLRMGLAAAKTTSLKSAWFSALESIALTPATVDWLERVWRHDVTIPGLPLAEPDEATLALEIAVRGVPDANAVLAGQLGRFKNPDRKARFAFVMPALSPDAATRDRFFQGLKDVGNRQHEAWVLEAVSYLHHPLRADASEPYIRPSLDLVREIQRTGDIFFPKRWADATLGGDQSRQAAADVHAFLDALPTDYPTRLKWVVQSSADQLFRAARLVR